MPTPLQMLDQTFEHGDFPNEITFREFFRQLLGTLLEEEEGFSGKRPFGNSGWLCEVNETLEAHGIPNPADFLQQMVQAL